MVIAVVKDDFEVLFTQWKNPETARVSTVSGVLVLSAPDTGTALPKQARYQLRYTPIFSFAPISRQFPNRGIGRAQRIAITV